MTDLVGQFLRRVKFYAGILFKESDPGVMTLSLKLFMDMINDGITDLDIWMNGHLADDSARNLER